MALLNKRKLYKIGITTLVAAVVAHQGTTAYAASSNLNKAFPITFNPGHGGSDPGYNGWKMSEKDVCIDLAEGFKQAMDLFSIENATANDTGNSITKRVDFAKKMKSLNVEIHNNGAENPDANGFEIFVQNTNNSMFMTALTTYSSAISKRLGMKDRGIKTDKSSNRGNLGATYVSDDSIGILLEVGFLSNPEEATKFDTKEKRLMIGFILGCELLASFNVISQEDANSSIKNFATKYNFIKNTKSVDELIEDMKKKVNEEYLSASSKSNSKKTKLKTNKRTANISAFKMIEELNDLAGDSKDEGGNNSIDNGVYTDNKLEVSNNDSGNISNATSASNNITSSTNDKVDNPILNNSDNKVEISDKIPTDIANTILDLNTVTSDMDANSEFENINISDDTQSQENLINSNSENLNLNSDTIDEQQSIVEEKVKLIKDNFLKEQNSNILAPKPNQSETSREEHDEDSSDEE